MLSLKKKTSDHLAPQIRERKKILLDEGNYDSLCPVRHPPREAIF
jgi:hypothetical protein